MRRLTTHVLDTAIGRPAAGVRIELWRPSDAPVLLKSTVTNADGRADEPLLAGDEAKAGRYELRFFVGDYFRSRNSDMPEPLFLDIVPVQFAMADAPEHYHVPLLISPFGYSTYRGS